MPMPNLRLIIKYGVIFYTGYRMGVGAEIKEIKERYVVIPKAIVQTYGLRTEQLRGANSQLTGELEERVGGAVLHELNDGSIHCNSQGNFYKNSYKQDASSKYGEDEGDEEDGESGR